jgi:hypothetical protein
MTTKTTAFAAVALAAWLAPTTGNASPINYTITISGGVHTCGTFRPLNVPCDAVITGSILVDSEGATLAEQLLAFSLEAAPQVTYLLSDSLNPAMSVTFDESGGLTGFVLPLFRRLDSSQPLVLAQYALRLTANAQGGSFAYEGAFSDTWNRCTGCVSISATAVSEPGASWLLIPAVALTLVMGRRRRQVRISI